MEDSLVGMILQKMRAFWDSPAISSVSFCRGHSQDSSSPSQLVSHFREAL